MGSLEQKYEYGVSDLGFSTDLTLTNLRSRERKDFWELCYSNGQERTKIFASNREKRDNAIQDLREKRHERLHDGQNMPSVGNYNKSGSQNNDNERKNIGKTMDLKLSSMPGIILNPIDKAKYEKALENILISKMRSVCMFPVDDADDHEEDSFFMTWNNRERVSQKMEKEKIGVDKEPSQPRLVFLKNTKIELTGDDDSYESETKVPSFTNRPPNILLSSVNSNYAQNLNKNSEKNKILKPKQLWKRKWNSSEYFPKMPIRCQATSSVHSECPKALKNVSNCPDLGGVLVCKRVSGDLENRSDLVNEIIEGLFPMDDQNHRLTQNESTTIVRTPLLDTGITKGPEKCPKQTQERPKPCPKDKKLTVKKIKNIKLRLTSHEQGKRPLMTSQPERMTNNGDLLEQATTEPSLSMVCLKKLFPSAKLELY